MRACIFRSKATMSCSRQPRQGLPCRPQLRFRSHSWFIYLLLKLPLCLTSLMCPLRLGALCRRSRLLRSSSALVFARLRLLHTIQSRYHPMQTNNVSLQVKRMLGQAPLALPRLPLPIQRSPRHLFRPSLLALLLVRPFLERSMELQSLLPHLRS